MEVFQSSGAGCLFIEFDDNELVTVKFTNKVKIRAVCTSDEFCSPAGANAVISIDSADMLKDIKPITDSFDSSGTVYELQNRAIESSPGSDALPQNENMVCSQQIVVKDHSLTSVEKITDARRSTRVSSKKRITKDGRKCGSCEKIFQNDLEFVKHQIVVHSDLQCFNCGNECLCKAHFFLHDESIEVDDKHLSEIELTECPLCFELIVSHMMKDPINKDCYRCCLCEQILENNTVLLKHFETHIEPNRTRDKKKHRDIIKCQYCEKVFKSEVGFRKHKKPSKISQVCDACGFETKSKAVLSLHEHLGHIQCKERDILNYVEKRTICHLCDTPVRRSQILQHIQTHIGEYPFKCCLCGHLSMTEILWVEHAETHIGRKYEENKSPEHNQLIKKLFMNNADVRDGKTCLLCKLHFHSEKDFIYHYRNLIQQKQCAICNTKTFTEAGVIVHKYISHDLYPDEDDPEKSFMAERVRKIWDENTLCSDDDMESIKCPCCTDSFTMKNLYLHVMENHTHESPFKCCCCKSLFSSLDHFIEHCDFHLGKKVFGPGSCYCKRCDLRFESTDAYYKHRVNHKVTCEHCGQTFISKVFLDNHMKNRHTSLSCSVCGKVFSDRALLFKHERRHTVKTHVQKKQCPKCGVMVAGLKSHMNRMHPTASSKTYNCTVCAKSFLMKGYLRRHLFVHTNDRPFECSICHLKLKSALYLKKHMKTHSAERPMLSCEICGKKAASGTNLRIHMRIHSTMKMFSCEYCDQGFNYKQSLLSHIRSKHSGK